VAERDGRADDVMQRQSLWGGLSRVVAAITGGRRRSRTATDQWWAVGTSSWPRVESKGPPTPEEKEEAELNPMDDRTDNATWHITDGSCASL
jgi:hypothetical protein